MILQNGFCLQCGAHTTAFIFRFASSKDRIGIKCKQPPAKHNAMEQSHSPASDEQGQRFHLNMTTIKLTIVKGAKEMGFFSVWISCYLHGDRHEYDLLPVRGVPELLRFS